MSDTMESQTSSDGQEAVVTTSAANRNNTSNSAANVYASRYAGRGMKDVLTSVKNQILHMGRSVVLGVKLIAGV